MFSWNTEALKVEMLSIRQIFIGITKKPNYWPFPSRFISEVLVLPITSSKLMVDTSRKVNNNFKCVLKDVLNFGRLEGSRLLLDEDADVVEEITRRRSTFAKVRWTFEWTILNFLKTNAFIFLSGHNSMHTYYCSSFGSSLGHFFHCTLCILCSLEVGL